MGSDNDDNHKSSIPVFAIIIPFVGLVLCLALFLALWVYRRQLFGSPHSSPSPKDETAEGEINMLEGNPKISTDVPNESPFLIGSRVDGWSWIDRDGIEKTSEGQPPTIDETFKEQEPLTERLEYTKIHSLEELNKSVNALQTLNRLPSSSMSSSSPSLAHKFLHFFVSPLKSTKSSEHQDEGNYFNESQYDEDEKKEIPRNESTPDHHRHLSPSKNISDNLLSNETQPELVKTIASEESYTTEKHFHDLEQCTLNAIRKSPTYPHDNEDSERSEDVLDNDRPKFKAKESKYPKLDNSHFVIPPQTVRIEKRAVTAPKYRSVQRAQHPTKKSSSN
jgi:hypothetical protein